MSPPIRPRYPVPAQRFRCEIEVGRSRFIATIQQICNAEEARTFVAELKGEFPDASHNCWAYLVGPPGSCDLVGLSDDGEPQGVAGRPMLTCLQHSGLGDVAVVVTRYFGGTKLGKGGMVKAYTAAVLAGLDHLPRAERIDWCELSTGLAYALLAKLEQRLPEFEAEIIKINYAENINLQLRLPAENEQSFRQMFQDLSAGQGQIKKKATA